MQMGEIKRDIDVKHGTAKNFWGDYTKAALTKEGEKLYRKHPEYKYLEEDPYIEYWKKSTLFTDNNVIYKSVVYAYMVDQLLKEHPEFNDEYKRIVQESINKEQGKQSKNAKELKEKADKTYSSFNSRFLRWYQDYLREQTDPGCLERERQERERKQQALKDAERIRNFKEHQQEQQDLATGKRVVCPYCKSTNTEKISGVARGVSIYVMGIASPKIGKQWHCNNCKSDF